MSTAPQDLSFYGITTNSAFLQWKSTGADTNYADVLCYLASDLNTPVFSYQNIYTPNTQYYSTQITGLVPGETYVCFIHSKLDMAGTGESVLVKSPYFMTLASSNPEIQRLVYIKPNIGGYFFDAFFQTDYNRSLTITDHPVESGASVSDHSFVNPTQLIFKIGMSDCTKSIIDGQFSGTSSRSLSAFQVLQTLQTQRIPVKVVTRLGAFDNMLVETIAVPDDNTTYHGLKATVTMREVFIATVKTVKISARPQVTGSTNKGAVNPVQPNQSILKQLEGLLGISSG